MYKTLKLIFTLVLMSASFISAQTTLKIAAAADLEPVLPSLIAPFQKSSGVHVAVSYASSATLTQQIINGAPFDLFLAADTSFPQKVIVAGDAVEASPTIYARGTLVLWASKSHLGSLSSTPTLQWMTNPAVQHIAIANPEHAPYGRAAVAALHGMGMYDKVQSKLVEAENIGQAAQYAVSGNAQCALISKSLALAPALRTSGTFIPIPPSTYPPIEQGAVVLRHTSAQPAAQNFLKWMLSSEGQQLLETGGLQRVH